MYNDLTTSASIGSLYGDTRVAEPTTLLKSNPAALRRKKTDRLDGVSQPLAVQRNKKTVLLSMGYYSHDRHLGVVQYAREAGWILDSWLTRAHGGEEGQIAEIEDLHYDGILCSCVLSAPRLHAKLMGSGVPVVEFGMNFPDDPVARVLFDDEAIGRTAADYYRSRGFTDMAFYGFEAESWVSRTRLRSFEAAVKDAGATCHRIIWTGRPEQHQKALRRPWLAENLRRLPKPLALMAVNDDFAVEVLDACEAIGIRVPEDIAVLGVDNDELVVDLTSVPLSSIPSSRHKIGYEGAALLDQLMDGKPPPANHRFIAPGSVVTRKSTDILAIKNPDVAAAMNYIYTNFAKPIAVDDVVAQTATSRRCLQDLFHTHIGRTILEEITRARVSHAKRLLAQTTIKTSAVAHQAGFHSREWMSKVFRQATGQTPRAYRNIHSIASRQNGR